MLAGPEVERFLSYLAVSRDVTVNTQNLAFNALIFLYRHVLNKPLVGLDAGALKISIFTIPVCIFFRVRAARIEWSHCTQP